jgi:hypothetical protein
LVHDLARWEFRQLDEEFPDLLVTGRVGGHHDELEDIGRITRHIKVEFLLPGGSIGVWDDGSFEAEGSTDERDFGVNVALSQPVDGWNVACGGDAKSEVHC